MATVIGRDRLSVVGPFGRAFAKCAGCDRLVHEKTKFGGFCCITCTMRHFDVGNPVGEHGHRCEDRLANDVDPDAYRDLDGNHVTGPLIAEPVLPCKTACSKQVQDLFKEAGLELEACVDQNQDNDS